MPRLTDSTTVVQSSRNHDSGNSSFWLEGTCPRCGRSQFLVMAATIDGNAQIDNKTLWLRCTVCRRGVVVNDGVAAPQATRLRAVSGLPEDVESAWEEVRGSHGAGASTAAVMMCRKILFHIAVEHGLPAKNAKDRAPTFTEVLDHLQEVGLVTPPMLPWVTKIKDVGNEANHDLPQTDPERALQVGTFTHQLLVLTYEMPAKMAEVVGEPDGEPEDPAESESALPV
ncbi:MAG TPA: DUF4145 domain-containing protein [Isoptericola sp.]|nr:DUF4145 domain-containing protein [Isoptericola sp.]